MVVMQIKRLLLCLTVLLVLCASSCNVFERKDSVIKEELGVDVNDGGNRQKYVSKEF